MPFSMAMRPLVLREIADELGLHWLNPAPVMQLVEVVKTVVTDPSVVEDIEALVAKVGKSDVTVGDRAASSPTRCCSAT